MHWTLDDAPHFWFDGATWNKTIRNAAEVRTLWEEEVVGIAALGGLPVLTMHPQIIGRPGRLTMLAAFLAWVREQPGVTFRKAREVAEMTP